MVLAPVPGTDYEGRRNVDNPLLLCTSPPSHPSMKLISRCISSTTRPHTAHSLSVPGLLVRCTPAIPVIRYQTTASTIPPAANESKSRRPSPYRLLPARTFLAHFAPLHVAGWRLDILPNVAATSRLAAQSSGSASTPTPIVDESGDLQDHLLVRAYSFEQTREGWEGAMRLVQRIGEVVADEDVSVISVPMSLGCQETHVGSIIPRSSSAPLATTTLRPGSPLLL